MRQPYLDLILSGLKTIESRFADVKCAPHGQIQPGDTVFLKKAGGSIVAEFLVGVVLSFKNPTSQEINNIQRIYGDKICTHVDPDFWTVRKNKKYITLIEIKRLHKLQHPYYIKKKDKRGWVILPD